MLGSVVDYASSRDGPTSLVPPYVENLRLKLGRSIAISELFQEEPQYGFHHR